MKVFVLGATGMVGHVMSRYLKEQSETVIDITRKDIDATWDANQIDWAVRSWGVHSDDYVINCIGLVPQVSADHILQVKVNTLFPKALVVALQPTKTRLIHISTNCVYCGQEVRAYDPHGYTEYDMPLTFDAYGATKWHGECPESAMVLRASVIGPGKQGFYKWCTEASEPINGYVDHYWNGLTTLELAKYVYWLIDRKQFGTGVRHVHAPNTVSKYDLIKEIHRINGVHALKQVTPYYTQDNKWLTLATISRTTWIPTIQQQLQELKQWY